MKKLLKCRGVVPTPWVGRPNPYNRLKMIPFSICLFCFLNISVFAEPIAPKETYFSKSKDANKPVEVPYKPPSPEELEAMEEEGAQEAEETESRFDWSNVPYLPFKRVKLPLAKDPEIE